MTSDIWINSALVLGLPMTVGMLGGLALRAAGYNGWLGVLGLVLAPGVAMLADWIPLGIWNLLLIGLEFGLFFWIALSAPAPLHVAIAVLVLVTAGLIGVEGWARLFLTEAWSPNAKLWPHLTSETIRTPLSHGEIPRLWPAPLDSWPHPALPSKPFIVHLGDSMIVGRDDPPGERATDQLKQLIPAIGQVNLGMSNTGPDVQFLELFDRFDQADRLPFLVVHHIFVGNDIENLDCDRNFCEGNSVLEYGPEGAVPCRHPRWRFSPRDLVIAAQPPYPLAAATSFSRAARLAANAFSTLRGRVDRCQPAPLEGPHPQDYERRWEHFEIILRTERDRLAARGVPLVVSILPFRRSVESDTPESTEGRKVHRRMVDVLARLGIRTLDVWKTLYENVRRDGSEAYFLPNGDVHFNTAGHQFYAQWLAGQLHHDVTLAMSATGAPQPPAAVARQPEPGVASAMGQR